MRNILLPSMAVILLTACSRDGSNSVAENQPPKETRKKLLQVIQNEKPLNSYKWENNKLVRIDYYKDGFLDRYTNIYYSGNLRVIDSTFNDKNSYIFRNTYSYNANDFLVFRRKP